MTTQSPPNPSQSYPSHAPNHKPSPHEITGSHSATAPPALLELFRMVLPWPMRIGTGKPRISPAIGKVTIAIPWALVASLRHSISLRIYGRNSPSKLLPQTNSPSPSLALLQATPLRLRSVCTHGDYRPTLYFILQSPSFLNCFQVRNFCLKALAPGHTPPQSWPIGHSPPANTPPSLRP